jgi:hypothetical protein
MTVNIPPEVTTEATLSIASFPDANAELASQASWFKSIHPDLHPSPIHNVKQSACYTSWLSYFKSFRNHPEYIHIIPETASTTSVLVWETVNKFGLHRTYTECDGIPRIEFLGSTKTVKSLVTETIKVKVNPVDYTVEGDKIPRPNCTDLDTYLCRKLHGID